MDYKVKPWSHQLLAIDRAKELPWFALFFEMGSGKTMTAINILRHKTVEKGRLLKILVLAPPITCENWKHEILMHSKIEERSISVLQASGKKRLQEFEAKYFEGDKTRPGIAITNYESLTLGSLNDDGKTTPGPLFTAFQRWRPDAIIFDESHRLKNYKAKRSKFAEKLANPVKIKTGREWKVNFSEKPLTYLLSGSPILNSPMDIFHPFLIMDGGQTFGTNFFAFRARFFRDKNSGMPRDRYFPDWEIIPGSLEEINRLIFKCGMRVTKAECMDLPAEVSVTIPCSMQPQQAKNYKEMKRDFITTVGDKTATATLAIVKALRLLQITSGFLPLNPQGVEEDQAMVVYPKTPKEEALRELLADLTEGSKVIVWAVWKENYKTIRKVCEELGLKYVEVHGEISRVKQNEAVEAFKTDASIKVFLGHPGSGGIGINLVAAPYSIFYSRNFSLEQWLQARARNHRGGQTEKVTHYDLVCTDTIDALVQEALAKKFDMSEKILAVSLALREQAN